jgi:hypothetical protein
LPILILFLERKLDIVVKDLLSGFSGLGELLQDGLDDDEFLVLVATYQMQRSGDIVRNTRVKEPIVIETIYQQQSALRMTVFTC